jgi:hypothetical protein
MSNYQTLPPADRDPALWRVAQKRAAFKSHLKSYVVINGFLWLIWFFTESRYSGAGYPWPIWSTMGWGIGLFFHFISAYVNTGNSVEREYQKLKNKQNQL